MVDTVSCFPVIKLVSSMSAAVLVKHTRDIFVDFGVPGFIVSDNERQLTSKEFRSFLSKNGVKYLNTPPFAHLLMA